MPMKCHYEILCVQRDASDEELKKSYRKLALKWHPDKNPGQEEECTAQFRSIQTAYDVLSDPQERAWYDKHREAILKGGLGHGDKYEDNSLNVFQYFNAGCYSGYGDDENGFFSVYREVFKTIATEDYEFMDDREEGWEMPDFGDSQSSYDDVVHLFYSYWESYCTAKSYVWVEKYDTREGPNRQIRRLMEADNKKLRDKAKKERNEEVRALVAFVRKRDKRVQAQKKRLEERAAEVARRTVERQEQQKRERLKNLEQYKETEWSAMSELEGDLAQLEAHFAEQFGDAHSEENSNSEIEEEDQFLDDLLCVACNKAFKSDRAFANHEKSKKHRENVALIKAEMEADDIDLDTVITGLDSVSIHTDDFVVDTNSKAKLSKKQKKKRKQQIQLQQSENEEEDDTIDVSKNFDQKDSSTEAERPTITQDDLTVIDDLESKSESLTKETKQESQGIHCSCNTCLKKFPSKTKLFDHLKATGHALRLEEPAKENNSNLKGKKKKKGKR